MYLCGAKARRVKTHAGGAGTHLQTSINSLYKETHLALVSKVAPLEAILSSSGWGGREVEEGPVPLDDAAFSSMSAIVVWS